MIVNCRNCGPLVLLSDEAAATQRRLRSRLDPPVCPRCDDELPSQAYRQTACHFCKATGADELIQVPAGDAFAHAGCIAAAEDQIIFQRGAFSA